MPVENPAILIVGGAWHTTEYLQPLAKVFKASGYSTHTVGLPSVGASPPALDFSGDVSAISDAALRLIADGKEVIVVLHSLAGIQGTEALHGLGKVAAGKGGVVMIVYVAAIVPRKGRSFNDHLEACGDTHWKAFRQKYPRDGMADLSPDTGSHMMYNDLDEEQTKYWTSLLRPQSVGVWDSPLTHETYNEIPAVYFTAALDQAFLYQYQLKTVEMLGFAEDKVVTFETGHCPWLARPEDVKKAVLQAADKYTS